MISRVAVPIAKATSSNSLTTAPIFGASTVTGQRLRIAEVKSNETSQINIWSGALGRPLLLRSFD